MSPEEQAADVVECLKAGAGAIHLHVRVTSESDRQAESLHAEDVARTLLAVRGVTRKESVGERQALIGVSTGAWILPDTAKRFEAVGAWEVLPDFASVNFSEDGAVELARLLLSRGVGVEAGLIDANSAEVFVASGLALSCLRILLEPQEQQMKSALETVDGIESVLKRALTRIASSPRVLLHGTEATAWPMMDEAIRRGYDVRVGLEDTLVMPDGRIASGNVDLVKEAVRRVKE